MRRVAYSLAVLLCLAAISPASGDPDVVRIGVLGLFHSPVIEVRAVGTALTLSGCGESARLEGGRSVLLEATPSGVSLGGRSKAFICDRIAAGGSAEVELSIPGQIRRRYQGSLEVRTSTGALEAVVAMRRDDALAAIIAAETDSFWPAAALEAQAIVSRSYLAAEGRRHARFDFCDSTHCQYLADAPPADGAVRRAMRATAPAVLDRDGKTIEALYTRSCGGETRTSAAAGLGAAAYRYHAVACPACSRRAFAWSRRFPISAAPELQAVRSEAARIDFVRRHGWSALPSGRFETRVEGDEIAVRGVGEGHGVGLCQRGAVEMARRGADWTSILRHFFPNASTR